MSWAYEERVVAFIDVLGYKALTSLDDARCEQIVELISCHLGAPQFAPETNPIFSLAGRHFSSRLFSDCICLSDEVSETGAKNIVLHAARLAHDLATHGIYVRGGITSGRHFQDVNIIFGEGIVRAYEIEIGRAKQPRIVVEQRIVDLLPEDTRRLVALDDDAEQFVDFWVYWEWEHPTFDVDLQLLTSEQQYAHRLEAFRSAKIWLDLNVQEATKSGNHSVTSKLKWLAAYQSARAREFLEAGDAAEVAVHAD